MHVFMKYEVAKKLLPQQKPNENRTRNCGHSKTTVHIYMYVCSRNWSQLETISQAKTIWLSCFSLSFSFQLPVLATEPLFLLGPIVLLCATPPATPPFGSLHQQLF